jgi:polysaccharide deacetylase 2 family uncharacterized protein YibQ
VIVNQLNNTGEIIKKTGETIGNTAKNTVNVLAPAIKKSMKGGLNLVN